MSGFLASLLSDYGQQLERHRNRRFLRATMAACALAAAADGEVSFSERMRVDQIFATLRDLEVFDPHEAVDLFNDYARAILESPRQGHERALKAVHAATADRDPAARASFGIYSPETRKTVHARELF